MPLVHKSVCVRPEIWRKLRVNAELTGVPVRDYLSYLIEQSSAVSGDDTSSQQVLEAVVSKNRDAGRATA